MRSLFSAATTNAVSQPFVYILSGLVILVGLSLYAWYIDRYWRLEKLGWVIYLGAVSAWEEWVFRLAVPYYLDSSGVDLLIAVVAANFVFAVLHFFTLRWKWQWCAAVFFFGMMLSRQMGQQFDLLLVVGIHWIFTFINTPRLPGRARQGG